MIPTHDAQPPPPREVLHLKPTNSNGFVWFASAVILTAVGLYLAMRSNWLIWFAGELILAAAFVQWFVLLHECGHRMLFRTRQFNALVGHVAGFFALIPFEAWKRVHERHHKWTGWQDVDPTTATLVPRRLALIERIVINVCWRCWIPLFATLYRLTNFWNVPRLLRMFPIPEVRHRVMLNLAILALFYLGIVATFGPAAAVRTIGVALLLGFIAGEVLLLSQHTHVPMKLSHGDTVDPFSPLAQQPFTRSLRLPAWLSTFLLHFDAHELHHMYPFVPGYLLMRIPYVPGNEVAWWRWIPAARAVPGEVFFFQNRDGSGFDI